MEVAQAKTPVRQLGCQTGFHTDEKEFGCSCVNSEPEAGNSVEEDLFPPPPPRLWPLPSTNTAVHFGNPLLKFHICRQRLDQRIFCLLGGNKVSPGLRRK